MMPLVYCDRWLDSCRALSFPMLEIFGIDQDPCICILQLIHEFLLGGSPPNAWVDALGDNHIGLN